MKNSLKAAIAPLYYSVLDVYDFIFHSGEALQPRVECVLWGTAIL